MDTYRDGRNFLRTRLDRELVLIKLPHLKIRDTLLGVHIDNKALPVTVKFG